MKEATLHRQDEAESQDQQQLTGAQFAEMFASRVPAEMHERLHRIGDMFDASQDELDGDEPMPSADTSQAADAYQAQIIPDLNELTQDVDNTTYLGFSNHKWRKYPNDYEEIFEEGDIANPFTATIKSNKEHIELFSTTARDLLAQLGAGTEDDVLSQVRRGDLGTAENAVYALFNDVRKGHWDGLKEKAEAILANARMYAQNPDDALKRAHRAIKSEYQTILADCVITLTREFEETLPPAERTRKIAGFVLGRKGNANVERILTADKMLRKAEESLAWILGHYEFDLSSKAGALGAEDDREVRRLLRHEIDNAHDVYMKAVKNMPNDEKMIAKLNVMFEQRKEAAEREARGEGFFSWIRNNRRSNNHGSQNGDNGDQRSQNRSGRPDRTQFDPSVKAEVDQKVAALRGNGMSPKLIYRTLVQEYHPDKGQGFEENFKYLRTLGLK